jgi:hypothetical protein
MVSISDGGVSGFGGGAGSGGSGGGDIFDFGRTSFLASLLVVIHTR